MEPIHEFMFINSSQMDDNRLTFYEQLPSLKEIKNEIITDLFQEITNPALTYTITENRKTYVVTINSDRQLWSAIDYFNRINERITITVQQNSISTAMAQSAMAASRTPSPTSTPSPVTTPSPTSTPSPLPTPSPTRTPSPHQQSMTLFNQPQRNMPLTIPTRPQGNIFNKRQPKLDARFRAHVTFDDKTSVVAANTRFNKTWRMENDGDLDWPETIYLLFVSVLKGDQMGSPLQLPISFPEPIKVGMLADITVPLTAPALPGSYTGFWKLAATTMVAGELTLKKFGQRIRSKIVVVDMPSQTVLKDDTLSVETKKKHLQLLFPNLTANGFENLVELFYDGINLEKGTIDEMLNGTIRNNDGTPLTMKRIISKVYWSHKMEDEEFPWEDNN